MDYIIRKVSEAPALDADFNNGNLWKDANIINVDKRMERKYGFLMKLLGKGKKPQDDFVPETQLKLLYDNERIYGMFLVKDRYIRAVYTGYQEGVCEDSCVEIFIRPANEKRYYNYEFNAVGAMLNYNVTALRAGVYTPVPFGDGKKVEIYHSLPDTLDGELTGDREWRLAFSIPFSFFEKYADNVKGPYSGQTWTAGVYKCSELSSHPHWLTWQELPRLDFHQPNTFGNIVFE